MIIFFIVIPTYAQISSVNLMFIGLCIIVIVEE